MNKFRPELLSPAGSLEKLKVASLYGADAVYVGGHRFGLRAAADNFTDEQLIEGVNFAHEKGVKVYLVLNGFLHDEDIEDLPTYLKFLESVKIDAVIVSDLGAVRTVKENSSIAVHLSTQASCLNVDSARFWKEMGVERIVLGRESTIVDAAKIKKEVDIEIEMFIHGSMCMAYSGNCTISNYTQGRDSNRGGCAHSCRFEYKLDFKGSEKDSIGTTNSFFMSSKDLNGIDALPQFIEHEIDSLKVEGRMKSAHYTGTISKVYSEAIDYFSSTDEIDKNALSKWNQELNKIVHRDYTDASLVNPAGLNSVYDKREHENPLFQVVGVIIEVKESFVLIQVRAKFERGDSLEFVPFVGDVTKVSSSNLLSALGDDIQDTKPGTLVRIPFVNGMEKYNILRKESML